MDKPRCCRRFFSRPFAARSLLAVLCSSAVIFSGLSCTGPSSANIELRKENQSLKDEIAALKSQQAADRATIAALQAEKGSVKRLEADQLDRLFTVAGLEVGRLTNGIDTDPSRPGDDAIRLQVVPRDVDGDPIKAAGTFLVEAFDLSSAEPRKIGQWTFDHASSRAAWTGKAMQYNYLFTCPLADRPTGRDVTVKITYRDELTGREFTEQRQITLAP